MSRNRTASIAIVGGLAVLAVVAIAASFFTRDGGEIAEPVDHPEVYEVLPQLRTAQDAFHRGLGAYEVLESCPPGEPGGKGADLGTDCQRTWAGLGVVDPGPLSCRYKSYEDGRVQATCDDDQDGVMAVYTQAVGEEIQRVTGPRAR